MNQSSNEASGLNLPPPVGEQLPVPNADHEEGVQSAEQLPAAPERVARAGAVAPPITPAAQTPISLPPVAKDEKSDVTTTTITNDLQVTDDGDLIEKEWVDKAKQIVERNRDDPHKQSEQLTEVRADYMKKRYNKIIKTNK